MHLNNSIAITVLLLSLTACRNAPESPKRALSCEVNDEQLTTSEQIVLLADRTDVIIAQNVHCTYGGASVPHFDSSSFFVAGGPIYFKAYEDGLEFASLLESDVPFDPASSPSLDKDIANIKGEWQWGSRVGIGYIFGCHDYWDLTFNWTNFSDKTHASISVSEPTDNYFNGLLNQDFLIPSWNPKQAHLLSSIVQSARELWKLRYNIYDLELGKNYFISRKITSRPFLGVRDAIIVQDVHASYNAIFQNPATLNTSLVLPTGMRGKNNYSGVGLRAGDDLLFHFGPAFSLFGKLSASLLYGHFHVEQKFFGFGTTGSSLVPAEITTDSHFHRLRANLEASAGIYWETYFNHDCSHLSISLGYELSNWFSQNQLERSNFSVTDNTSVTGTSYGERGDLQLRGYNAEIRFDF